MLNWTNQLETVKVCPMQTSLFDLMPRQMTVKAATEYIRRQLEGDSTLQNLWLEGEISNWKQATSGHIYFTLKDRQATIRCVVWRAQANRLRYRPHGEGDAVLAHGRVSVYEAGGNYQFYVDELQPLGQGDLHAEFERIKHRLADEGLFDESLKQPLPRFPQTIGIVTSAEAAALQDILTVLRRRYPLAQVILAATLVQGAQAPQKIMAALQSISQQAVDLIILARGGGSLEDLWAFNDETVARTIVECPIPIISGVGHEVDTTIADFAADVRAATPSAAAELAVPDMVELQRQIVGQRMLLTNGVRQQLHQLRTELQRQTWALQRLSPQQVINNHRQQLDSLVGRLERAAQNQLTQHRHGLIQLQHRLNSLNPEAVLGRGYAIVQKGPEIISDSDELQPDDELTIRFKSGQTNVIVK